MFLSNSILFSHFILVVWNQAGWKHLPTSLNNKLVFTEMSFPVPIYQWLKCSKTIANQWSHGKSNWVTIFFKDLVRENLKFTSCIRDVNKKLLFTRTGVTEIYQKLVHWKVKSTNCIYFSVFLNQCSHKETQQTHMLKVLSYMNAASLCIAFALILQWSLWSI